MNELADTKRRLLDAALTTVREHGVAGATSRQIAAAAGTNLQAITYHFGSKDELVAQALIGAVRTWIDPVRALLHGMPDDPASGLTTALERIDDVANRVADQVPAYLEALAQVPRRAEYRAQVHELLAELRTDVAHALHGLKASGALGEWVDPDAMAALVVAAADGVAIHFALEPDSASSSQVLQQAGGLLLAAMAPGH
jgi:AcrR family transcriptional regulator